MGSTFPIGGLSPPQGIVLQPPSGAPTIVVLCAVLETMLGAPREVQGGVCQNEPDADMCISPRTSARQSLSTQSDVSWDDTYLPHSNEDTGEEETESGADEEETDHKPRGAKHITGIEPSCATDRAPATQHMRAMK